MCFKVVVLAAGCLLLAAAGRVVWPYLRPLPMPVNTSQADLLAALARGEPGAVEWAREAIDGNTALFASLVDAAMRHESTHARVAGCELLAGAGRPEALSLLVARSADADWRVRMRAYGALAGLHSTRSPLPLRNSPIDHREEWLLAWLADVEQQVTAQDRLELCEVFAGARFVEFGRPLAARCLSCHAGESPAPFSASGACASCHAGIHAQWAGSAHANSLLHLHLLTPRTDGGEAEWMDFGEVRGLGCLECHRLKEGVGGQQSAVSGELSVISSQCSVIGSNSSLITHDSTLTTPSALSTQNSALTCAFDFDPAQPASGSCGRCHASSQREWEVWTSGPQPRRAVWPPGQVDLAVYGDQRGCIDCHMKRAVDESGSTARDHLWAARRDLKLLREAVAVLPMAPAGGGRSGQLGLAVANLSGHAFPTGTRRRVIRLYVGPQGEPELPLLVEWSTGGDGVLGSKSAALRPGQQQIVPVATFPGADLISYRLVYVRDRFMPKLYSLEICSGTMRISSTSR
ncbi:MAG: hypothetical protein AMXMBFR13_12000 [Phycisphaerae bacterium]